MGMSLREVLELEPVRRGQPAVLAGADRLGRSVRWVHVAELPDIARLLHGGELLLTTGMGIAGRTVVEQSSYVTGLAEAGAAGLVIELGRNFAEIPGPMVRAAGDCQLPLVALRRETRFVEVTETVHRAILSRQYESMRRAETVSRDLTELILSGSGPGEIVSRLAEIFASPVVLEDEAHQVVEVAGPRVAVEDALASWEAHSRAGHDDRARGGVGRCVRPPRCLWVGLWLRHHLWGRLHVLGADNRPDELTELLVDRAGAALALAVLAAKDAAHLADRAGSALVSELVEGRYGSPDELLRRARTLGADLTRGRLVAIAIEPAEHVLLAHAVSEEERLEHRLAIAERLRAATRELGCPALVGLHGDRIVVVAAVPGSRSIPVVTEAIVSIAGERAAGLIAGVSNQTVPDGLHHAVNEAMTALALGRRDSSGRRVHHASDLGTYQLLVHLAQGPELARFVESELRAVLDHDARGRAKLLPTLRAYLRHTGRKAETVRELQIQRRTLYARLRRLEVLLCRDLGDQGTRTRLTLALQGLDLLHDRHLRQVIDPGGSTVLSPPLLPQVPAGRP